MWIRGSYAGVKDAKDWIRVRRGVRQGGVISPRLFNIYTDDLEEEIRGEDEENEEEEERFVTLKYTDDTLIFAKRKEAHMKKKWKMTEGRIQKELTAMEKEGVSEWRRKLFAVCMIDGREYGWEMMKRKSKEAEKSEMRI